MVKPPGEYEPSDSRGGDGEECCAACGYDYWGSKRELFTADGTKHANLLDTDPGDKPFFCPDCWPRVDAERKRRENKTLGEYVE